MPGRRELRAKLVLQHVQPRVESRLKRGVVAAGPDQESVTPAGTELCQPIVGQQIEQAPGDLQLLAGGGVVFLVLSDLLNESQAEGTAGKGLLSRASLATIGRTAAGITKFLEGNLPAQEGLGPVKTLS